MSNAIKASDWYGEAFKVWSVKTHGPKPDAELLEKAHAFGRPGKQSLALAMAMRDCGVTGQQVMFACDGKPQNNHRVGLIKAKLLKRVEPFQAADGHTVYKVELTTLGVKRIEQRAAAAADAALPEGDKPKGKVKKAASKPRKAKGKAVEAPEAETVEPVPVIDAPVTVDAVTDQHVDAT